MGCSRDSPVAAVNKPDALGDAVGTRASRYRLAQCGNSLRSALLSKNLVVSVGHYTHLHLRANYGGGKSSWQFGQLGEIFATGRCGQRLGNVRSLQS